jgi:hypothetical protein
MTPIVEKTGSHAESDAQFAPISGKKLGLLGSSGGKKKL